MYNYLQPKVAFYTHQGSVMFTKPSAFADVSPERVVSKEWRSNNPLIDANTDDLFIRRHIYKLLKQYCGRTEHFRVYRTGRIRVVNTYDVARGTYTYTYTHPVYWFIHATKQIEIIASGLKDGWHASVALGQPVAPSIDMERLCDNPSRAIDPQDCRGFKPEWVFPPYSENALQFTVSIAGVPELYNLIKQLIENYPTD